MGQEARSQEVSKDSAHHIIVNIVKSMVKVRD